MAIRDDEILSLLKQGKQGGMDLLFERYYKPLVVYANAWLHDLEESEDLVQEQFVKLWEKSSFDGIVPGALSSFLFTVVKNACANLLEKKKLPVESLDLPHFQIAQNEAQYLDEVTVKLISDSLRKLPEKTQKVVECVMLNDKMYKEAAEELGVSINTVKTLLKQGIRELRELLGDKQDMIFFFIFRKVRRNG